MKISWIGKALIVSAMVFFLASVAPAQTSKVAPRITQPVDESVLITLQHNTHPLAQARFDQGPVDDSLPLERLLLVLQRSPAQEASLRTLLDQQQDKTSPNYHKWLTPEQYGLLYGPADADLQTITGWLESHGFTVTKVTKARNFIEFTGTAGLVRNAFHTEIHNYLVNGEEHIANSSDPQIPAALAPVVTGVASLHNFFPKPHFKSSGKVVTAPPRSAGQVPHLSDGMGDNFLGPLDFDTIYNLNPLINAGTTGSGRTIAVLGVTDIVLADVTLFYQVFDLNDNVNVIHNGTDPGDLQGGDREEATLDVEWSGGIAQGATIDFVVSKSTATQFGTDLSAIYVEESNLADVMSVSYGACEKEYEGAQAQLNMEEEIGEQAAAQGITYVASAGDAGAEDCATSSTSPADGAADFSVDVPGSTTFVTSVGGTEFNEGGDPSLYWTDSATADETALSYIPEVVWNDSCTSGTGMCSTGETMVAAGGGGESIFFAKPAWQTGFSGTPTDTMRDVPDVSVTASADHDPYVICISNQTGACVQSSSGVELEGIGGTSASAQAFGGVMAVIDQSTDSRQGLANYVFYKLAAGETFSSCNGSGTPALPASGPCIFNDTTSGNNAVPGETSYGTASPLYAAGTGYDKGTGLGSTNVNNLATKWSTASFDSTTTTLTGVPASGTSGTGITVQVTVTSGSGTPAGDVSVIATPATCPAVASQFQTLSAGAASLSLTLPSAGTYSVVAHYAGNGTFGPSDSAPSSITVTGTGCGAFTMSASPTAASVEPGATASTVVTANASNGFSGSVSLSASVAGPSGAVDSPACSFIPSSIALSSSAASGTSTLSCTTTASSHVLFIPTRGPSRPIWIGVSAALALASLFLLSLPLQKRRWETVFAMLVLAAVAAVAGCGGGGGGGSTPTPVPGTTAGTYTVTVTGAVTSGSSQTSSFTITVE